MRISFQVSKIVIFTICFFFQLMSFSQIAITPFTEDPAEVLKQLEVIMTANKNANQEKIFKVFEEAVKKNEIQQDEWKFVVSFLNFLQSNKLPSNPYFNSYLDFVPKVASAETGSDKFIKWHQILLDYVSGIEGKKWEPILQFLEFGKNFFGKKTILSSDINWFARSNNYSISLEDKLPVLKFDKLDLVAERKGDSIVLIGTSGKYFPLTTTWIGSGGTVTWESVGLDKNTYCEIKNYQANLQRGEYKSENSVLHYPLLFPNSTVIGTFEDKLVTGNKAIEGSYPRFESLEKRISISDIGGGITYKGGFKLQGTTVYGYGEKENLASIEKLSTSGTLLFRGLSELFVIRKGDKISGEKVALTMKLNQDSLYHQAVGIVYEIDKQKLRINRGTKGSERSPFYNTYHQLNIGVENMNWYILKDTITIGEKNSVVRGDERAKFESLKYYDDTEYQRIQNISSTNPLATLAVIATESGSQVISAQSLAYKLNPKFSIENIQSLLYELVEKGFIDYNPDKQEVTIREKITHYGKASQKKTDFDVLSLDSSSDKVNGVISLKSLDMDVGGIKKLELSERQMVKLFPAKNNVKVLKNRDMKFDGKLYAGFGIFEGKKFDFNYSKYISTLDSVRYLDLFIPSGEVDKNLKPIRKSLSSTIEYLTGVLLLDAPNNKSGRVDLDMFPSFQSKANSYVYYDRKDIQDSCYTRDSFYFKLDKFSFNSLDNFKTEDVKFKGTMVSSKIFPDFLETILVRDHDKSLGFVNKTPEAGYPTYSSKGNYIGEVDLSNKGFLGKGLIQYLKSTAKSEDIIFKPKQLLANAKAFDNQEDREGKVKLPQVHGTDVSINWLPYKDSMYVRSKAVSFDMFKADKHKLQGLLILTPSGVKGRGVFEWDEGWLKSNLISFGPFEAQADTADFKIKTLSQNADDIAFDTRNMNIDLNFDTNVGKFKANSPLSITTLPYNKYVTTMNQFTWDMTKKTIDFKSGEGLANFLSTDPNQDSLRFKGKTAFYDLEKNILRVGGIPHIISADAFIYPDSSKVEIKDGGILQPMTNAKIITDTLSKYHVINKVDITISGRKDFKAKGFYEYNIGDRKQEFLFEEIIGSRVGAGQANQKNVRTRATAIINEEDSFYIDTKTKFQGEIKLESNQSNLTFKGLALLDLEKLPGKNWFEINSVADKNNLIINFDEPKNIDGSPTRTGIFMSREYPQAYMRIMNPTYTRKDRALFDARGAFRYNKSKDELTLGDSMKIAGNGIRGAKLVFSNKDKAVNFEGPLNICSGLNYVKCISSGFGKTGYPDITFNADSTFGAESFAPVTMDVVSGLDFIVPEELTKIMYADIRASAVENKDLEYASPWISKAFSDIIKDEKEYNEAMSTKTGVFTIPKKSNPFTLLFSKLPLKWDSEYQSFISTDEKIGLVSIKGEPVNLLIKGYVEFRMPSNEDDRFYIYLKGSGENDYFFGYQQGVLSIASSNTQFMQTLEKMKTKDLVKKMPDGDVYEIQPVESGTADMFVRRVQAAKNRK
jgi:hypothetical protein